MTSSRNISFNSSAATPASMFSCRMTSSPTIYVVVHVDDILIFGNQASWNAALTHVWPRAMKLRISANPVISWVSQSSRSDIPRSAHSRHYHPSSRLWGPTKVRNGLTNLISRLASPLSAPAPSKTLATPPPISLLDHTLYRQRVCSRIHLSVLTRPNISEVVTRLHRYRYCPKSSQPLRHQTRVLPSQGP